MSRHQRIREAEPARGRKSVPPHPQRYFTAIHSINQLFNRIAYGVVHRARDHGSNRKKNIVALKQVRIFDSDRGNGIPITALREISILKSLRHPNVVNVLDVAVGAEFDEVYMVMEYAEQVGGNFFPFGIFT